MPAGQGAANGMEIPVERDTHAAVGDVYVAKGYGISLAEFGADQPLDEWPADPVAGVLDSASGISGPPLAQPLGTPLIPEEGGGSGAEPGSRGGAGSGIYAGSGASNYAYSGSAPYAPWTPGQPSVEPTAPGVLPSIQAADQVPPSLANSALGQPLTVTHVPLAQSSAAGSSTARLSPSASGLTPFAGPLVGTQTGRILVREPGIIGVSGTPIDPGFSVNPFVGGDPDPQWGLNDLGCPYS
jgi:hypothetical protein